MKLKEITFTFEGSKITVAKTSSGNYQISGSLPTNVKRTDIIVTASQLFKKYNKEN